MPWHNGTTASPSLLFPLRTSCLRVYTTLTLILTVKSQCNKRIMKHDKLPEQTKVKQSWPSCINVHSVVQHTLSFAGFKTDIITQHKIIAWVEFVTAHRLCVLAFRCPHGLAPSYLSETLHLSTEVDARR